MLFCSTVKGWLLPTHTTHPAAAPIPSSCAAVLSATGGLVFAGSGMQTPAQDLGARNVCAPHDADPPGAGAAQDPPVGKKKTMTFLTTWPGPRTGALGSSTDSKKPRAGDLVVRS